MLLIWNPAELQTSRNSLTKDLLCWKARVFSSLDRLGSDFSTCTLSFVNGFNSLEIPFQSFLPYPDDPSLHVTLKPKEAEKI